jgi:hypothetical protein
VFSKEHLNTLTSMNNVAGVRSNQYKSTEAGRLYRETFAMKEKVSRKENPETLMSISKVVPTY